MNKEFTGSINTNLGLTKCEVILDLVKSLNSSNKCNMHGSDSPVNYAISEYEQLVKNGIIREE